MVEYFCKFCKVHNNHENFCHEKFLQHLKYRAPHFKIHETMISMNEENQRNIRPGNLELYVVSYIRTYIYISLSTLVLNSRDQQGNLWLLQKICLQNNLTTIFFLHNAAIKSIGTMLLAP